MGCMCSKGAQEQDLNQAKDHNKKNNLDEKFKVQLVAPTPLDEFQHHDQGQQQIVYFSSSRRSSRHYSRQASRVSNHNPTAVRISQIGVEGENNNDMYVENGKFISKSARHHQRGTTMDLGNGFYLPRVSGTFSTPHDGDIDPEWPQWLTSVAGDAVRGWLPRQANTFQKLEKIGQGTYSTVYRARDLQTGKIVAMKQVRFVNMDPESVRFMAREISILRKLDHPNVMKLECIVTSRMSESLYLVFEYMDHDLTGLATRPGVKFTEQQIKCYMQQLLRGLQHCHDCKIGDFGLANFYQDSQTLTSRVVTLWYRAPELLLGATQYGAGIDLWSAGCILAELFAGKHIMPGRTEVEQMHKIFKLCGSPSEKYWRRTRFPHATSFKPQQPFEPEARGTAASALESQVSLLHNLFLKLSY
ncbi:Probable serine/threonine-protein kinase At1g09600 [Linum perenne]